MKWIIVMAMITNGQLGFSETHDYDTEAECKAEFHRLLELYIKDGRRLEDMNGGCYPKVAR